MPRNSGHFLFYKVSKTYSFGKATFMPLTRISEIIKGNWRITADTALRLSRYFGTTPKFWLGLQNDFDLDAASQQKESALNDIVPIGNHAA